MIGWHSTAASFSRSERATTAKQALIVAVLAFAIVFFAVGRFLPNTAARTPLNPSTADTPGIIPAGAAQTHIGQTATVEGVVSGIYTARSGSATFIDMDGRYPSNSFTGVIFPDNASRIGDIRGLTGKTIDLTGTIRLYRGKPEIILRSASQIAVR